MAPGVASPSGNSAESFANKTFPVPPSRVKIMPRHRSHFLEDNPTKKKVQKKEISKICEEFFFLSRANFRLPASILPYASTNLYRL